MTIRTITPPIETQYGSDTTVQFGEILDFRLKTKYIDDGGGVEQWFELDIIMQDWQGGASAAEGGTPLREDGFKYVGKIGDSGFPFTQAMWDSLRQLIGYEIVMNDADKPPDDPNAYARGVAHYD